MKSDKARLEHIRDAIEKIIEFSKTKDEKSLSAILHQITIIGEATRQISPSLKSVYPHIPWTDIIGMRNRVIHEYFDVDHTVIWDTVSDDIPQLREWVKQVLNDL